MAGPRALEELQRWMLAAVAGPASVGDAAVEAAILPGRQQTAAERLAVYQHAYVARLLEVLREQFPCTRYVAGEDTFDQFALGYLQAHPPRSYTLGRLADHWVEYLDATRPADWGEFLVEVAQLEQAIERVFDGPGPEGLSTRWATLLRQEPLTENALVEAETHCNVNAEADTGRMPVPPEALRLSLVPGFELIAFRYPASAFYTAWKAGSEPAWPEAGEQYVALLRHDYVVRRHEVDRVQYALLIGLQAGIPLDEALQSAAEGLAEPAVDELALSVEEWFAKWTAAGFFARIGG